jgi:predicted  nucleic acid-binding Zn ribbon protein
MYKQRISITINSDSDKEKLFDAFIILMGSLCRTGQIMGGVESPYFAGNEIICYQTTLESDSLDSRHNDEWVNLRIRDLERGCNAKLNTGVVGQHIPFYKDMCTCDHRASYILFTTYSNESSPIDCGTCRRPVPVYKIKELTDKDRTDLESWEGDYVSCDSLNMGCNVGENWAIKQMSDPNSQLSQFGRAICNRIEEATGLPTYYYLFNYRTISFAKDRLRKCPSCNGEWFQDKKGLDCYDFKCDKCKLISTLTSKS